MFGRSMFGDFDQDPFFAQHQQQMQQMNQLMMNPFGNMFAQSPQQHDYQRRGDRHQSRSRQPVAHHPYHQAHGQQQMGLSPFGGDIFGQMNSMMSGMNSMMANMQSQMAQASAAGGNAPMYSHSSVMTYSSDGQSQPKVYQATKTTRRGAGGVSETQQTVRDSERAIAKMALDRQIGERRHVITKQKNLRTGDMEENNDYDNLDEEEADAFHQEFQQQAFQHHGRTIAGGRRRPSPAIRDRE